VYADDKRKIVLAATIDQLIYLLAGNVAPGIAERRRRGKRERKSGRREGEKERERERVSESEQVRDRLTISIDKDFISQFLRTHHRFVDSKEFLQKLINRYLKIK
jgi:hypothetical protein